MKSVLISIQPKWCELIASGKKTVEVRKTKPKLDTPFKVYIYCTKGNDGKYFWTKEVFEGKLGRYAIPYVGNGKVIGEFVCDYMNYYTSNCTVFESVLLPSPTDLEEMCLTLEELNAYGTRGKLLYGWHISNLVIYDKPRELSEFYAEGDCDCMNCKKCAWFDRGNGYNVENDCNLAYKCVDLHKSFKPIIRPPQSWCYVESDGKDEV